MPFTQYMTLLSTYLHPQQRRVALLAGLLLSGIGLQLLSPQFIRRFIDTVQTGGAQSALYLAAFLRRRVWQGIKADVITDVGWAISKTFYDLGTVAGMGLGAYLYVNGSLSLGAVYLIIHYLAMLNGPINRIARQLEDWQQVRVAVRRVRELTATHPNVIDGPGVPLPHGQALPVSFDDVSFAYQTDTPVLRNISFDLRPGETLGLLGRTGSGKTTLSRLLFRLYDVDQGAICLGGVDLRQTRLADLRQRVALVTQEVQLFPASVRDNLTLFDPTIDDDKLLASLGELGLAKWIKGLPQGLDTQLAANGAGLSAGEGQLLALARVFLKDPGLVILDEASSRLDPLTERLLEQALDQLLRDRTSIIIAHRLATVRRADQILILANGAVKENGPYQRLADDPHSVFAGLLRSGLTEVLA